MVAIRVLEIGSTYYTCIAVDVLYTYRIRIIGFFHGALGSTFLSTNFSYIVFLQYELRIKKIPVTGQ